MEDCVFCKIIDGKLPSNVIYEDEDILAFLDISQSLYGHTLVIPKKHYANVFECDEVTLQKIIVVCQKIARHYVEDCGFDGVKILNQNGEIAGQSVFHIHYHVLPYANNTLDPKTPLDVQREKLKMI